jgi:hypothetical protein
MGAKSGTRVDRWVPVGVAAALAAALLSGCATGPRLVRTDVTTFNDWPSLPADRSYAFARTLEYRDSLEVRSYEDLVRDALATQGFTLASDPSSANLVVTLRPSEIGATVRVHDPWSGYWGGFGPYGGFYGRGFAWYDPLWNYGYGSAFANDFSVEVVQRRLELDIDSRGTSGKRYYEGRVESSGAADSLPRAMPILIRALFVDFPGNNGQTRRVDVPVARRSGEPGAPEAR